MSAIWACQMDKSAIEQREALPVGAWLTLANLTHLYLSSRGSHPLTWRLCYRLACITLNYSHILHVYSQMLFIWVHIGLLYVSSRTKHIPPSTGTIKRGWRSESKHIGTGPMPNHDGLNWRKADWSLEITWLKQHFRITKMQLMILVMYKCFYVKLI